jgi:hypothetical protein
MSNSMTFIDLMESLLNKVNLLAVLPIIISAIAAFISFLYFRKSKKHADTVLLNSYISEAVKEFERKGSPINYIRSIVLPDEKKKLCGSIAIFAILEDYLIDYFQICLFLLHH